MGQIAAFRPTTSFGAFILHVAARPGADPSAAGGSPVDPDRELLLAALDEYPHGTRWFRELIRIHWDLVWSLCRAIVHDERAAENAAKHTFLRVHRRLERYPFELRFSTWMCAIAREVATDAVVMQPGTAKQDHFGRMRARIARLAGRKTEGRGRPLPPHRIFAALEPEDRQILALQCVEGASDEDVAGAMGIDPARLGARLAVARARLAALLGPPGAAGAKEVHGHGASALDPREIAAVRAALGDPDRERIVRAMDEIEHQVALEDMVVMLVRSVVEAAQEFFEVAGQSYGAGEDPARTNLGE